MHENATLVQQSYATIREDVISGVLEPDTPLRIDHLKDRYSVGASPLREALSRLLTDGLVTSEGLRGFRVAPVSLIDFRDITDTRRVVEPLALRIAIQRGGVDWEGRIVAAHHHLSRLKEDAAPENLASEMERLNRDFHLALIEGSKSPHLVRICMQLFDYSRRYRNISLRSDPSRRIEVTGEHDRIFKATLRRDVATAVRLLEKHIEGTFLGVSKAFASSQRPGDRPPQHEKTRAKPKSKVRATAR